MERAQISESQTWMYSVLDLMPLTLWHPTLIRALCPSMPVEGAGRCCKLSIGTEAWRDEEGVSGVPPGPLGLGVSTSESSRELSWLFKVGGGSSLSFAVVVGELYWLKLV